MNNQAYDDTATRNPRKAYTDYENSTYTVVSKVAYLIGVQKRIFENEYEPPKMEWYEKLHADKNARIVRNLCMIRTALELNFKAINIMISTTRTRSERYESQRSFPLSE